MDIIRLMKKTILISTAVVVFLGLFSVSVFAQNSTSSERACIQVVAPLRNKTTNECRIFPTPCDVPPGLGADWQQDQTCLGENQTSTRLTQKEQRAERIKNFTSQMQERLNVIVGNLERTALRIETQIDKLASSTATSADLTAARAKLADTKTKITELKTAISNLTVKAGDIIKSKTSKTAFYAVKEGIVKKILIAKIKIIHKELLDVVLLAKKEIIKTKVQNKDNPTSTVVTTTAATTTNN